MEERAAAAAGIKMVCSRVAFGVRWSEPVRQARLRAFFAVVQTSKKSIVSVFYLGVEDWQAKDFLSDAASRAYGTRHERQEATRRKHSIVEKCLSMFKAATRSCRGVQLLDCGKVGSFADRLARRPSCS